ncbi:MAG: hypothetical protein ACYTXY_53610, partial [Nostoc sp.]
FHLGIPGVTFDKALLGISLNTVIPAGKQWIYAGSLYRFASSSLGKILIFIIIKCLLAAV